jgi:hypothetical protein
MSSLYLCKLVMRNKDIYMYIYTKKAFNSLPICGIIKSKFLHNKCSVRYNCNNQGIMEIWSAIFK